MVIHTVATRNALSEEAVPCVNVYRHRDRPGKASQRHPLTAQAIRQPLGELDSILGVRRAPTAVVFVGQASYLAALPGFREEQVSGFLEERIDERGLHYFTLLTTERAVEAVAGLAGSGRLAASSTRFRPFPVSCPPPAIISLR